MAATYRVEVYQKNIIALIQVGDGARWIRRTTKRIEDVARATAPKDTGSMAMRHYTVEAVGSNQYVKRYQVKVLAPYAAYVHGGTGIYGPYHRPIRSIKGMGPLPGAGGRRPRYIWYSKGQKANPWLENAAESVVRVL